MIDIVKTSDGPGRPIPKNPSIPDTHRRAGCVDASIAS